MTMKNKIFDVQNLLWLALVLALAGSLKHLANIFASIDGNLFMGWLQAIAIDVGLFALAYSIRLHKVAKRNVKSLWFGVIVFTGISVYGNLAYGLAAISGNLPPWMAIIKPYILAGSLPILVLFLSELLSNDRQFYRQKESGKSPKIATTKNTGKPKIATITANGKKQKRQEKLLAIYQANPATTITELATKLNVSRATVRNYGDELGIEFAANGNGRMK